MTWHTLSFARRGKEIRVQHDLRRFALLLKTDEAAVEDYLQMSSDEATKI